MTSLHQSPRHRIWIALIAIAAALILTPSSVHAQSSNCSAGALLYYADDGNQAYDIEQAACIYYDGESGVDTNVETDNDSYSDWQDLGSLWIYGIGTDASVYASYSANIYDDETGLYDSGMVQGATSDTGGDSVNINYSPPWGYTTYALATYWDSCYQIPGEYDDYGCTWSTSDGGPFWGQWVTLQVAAPAPPSTPVYSYTITPLAGTSGYSSNGNLASYTDSVMGSWSFGYDALNRLTSASASPAIQGNSSFAWTYDSFGNRLTQTSNAGINILTGANPQNQVASTNARGVWWTPGYDAAGNIQSDGANQYLYDADGHVCAEAPINSSSGIQYLYNASGQRVGKGTITSLSCDMTQNGFSLTYQYILGPNGEQMTEISYSGGTSTWQHTNAYAGGAIATYLPSDSASPHFRFTDWLGTTRAQTDNTGNVELTCQSLPFGDDPSMTQCSTPPKTEQFFTGQERDQESGNDYFQARHYSNAMGRFLSPDPSGLTYADPSNPQSFNLYSYAQNNPLKYVDPTGLDQCIWDDGSSDDRPEDGGATEQQCNDQGGNWMSNTDTQVTVRADGTSGCAGNCGEDPMQPLMDWYRALYYMTRGNMTGSQTPPTPEQYFQAIAAQTKPINTAINCSGSALAKNGVALGLDAAGVGANFLPGGDLVIAGAQMGVGAASTVNSAVHNDVGGALGGIGGGILSASTPAAKYVGVGAKAIPVLGALVSVAATGNDLNHMHNDYQTCMAGY